MDRSRHQWRPQTAMLLLVVAVGTAGAMRPSIPKLPPVEGYNGCFDEDGALIRDLKAHVDAGKPVFSQLDGERKLEYPRSYYKTEYGRRPKYLFHWTTKGRAKSIATDGYIKQTEASDGDAYLGEGVYLTAIPGWADPEVVRKNNYGGLWKNFNKWNTANAYIRVDYAALFEILEIKPKADWQSNFCVRVDWGKLLLTPRIEAVASWDMKWDRENKEWIENEDWDWIF